MLIVLIAPFIPHHHHDTEVCVMMERCEQDEDANVDSHAENMLGQSCVAEARYEETPQRKVNENIQANRLYPTLERIVQDYLNMLAEEDEKPAYGVYVCSYRSPVAFHTNGLRAPPFHI